MFFHLSINHFAPVLIRVLCGAGEGKKGGLYDGLWYGFTASSYRHVWGREILCGVGNWICRGQMGCIGVIMVNADRIWLDGKIAPGPDYRLYLTPKYVETGAGF